jgi:peptidyl-prolyl cis-trans isomerase B (cyclophilin B)
MLKFIFITIFGFPFFAATHQEVPPHIDEPLVKISEEQELEIQEEISQDTSENNSLTNKSMPVPVDQLQHPRPQDNDEVAVMNTSKGKIIIRFFPEMAPKSVENFLGLSKKGYYDGIKFHRVIEGFMIQGGDPLGNGTGGESLWGASFEDEFHKDAKNNRGSLSMANAGPNTNGSQFFINQVDNNFLDNRHSVFGEVILGMNIVDSISETKTGPMDAPVQDITIDSIEVVPYSEVKGEVEK